jgi:hypothetical protein
VTMCPRRYVRKWKFFETIRPLDDEFLTDVPRPWTAYRHWRITTAARKSLGYPGDSQASLTSPDAWVASSIPGLRPPKYSPKSHRTRTFVRGHIGRGWIWHCAIDRNRTTWGKEVSRWRKKTRGSKSRNISFRSPCTLSVRCTGMPGDRQLRRRSQEDGSMQVLPQPSKGKIQYILYSTLQLPRKIVPKKISFPEK